MIKDNFKGQNSNPVMSNISSEVDSMQGQNPWPTAW